MFEETVVEGPFIISPRISFEVREGGGGSCRTRLPADRACRPC